MSHKFHGKGSGKKKTEKRVKKLQEEFVSWYQLVNALIKQPFLIIESSECWHRAKHLVTSSGETEIK